MAIRFGEKLTSQLGSSELITVLLATYNWPQALGLCLHSLNDQTDRHFEVLIADDGSTAATADLLQTFTSIARFPFQHVWQEDIGFRKARILNAALERAQGTYLVFLDGDCMVQPDFIARHRQLAQVGHLVTGSRVLLNAKLTDQIIDLAKLAGSLNKTWSFKQFLSKVPYLRLTGGINKALPFFIKFPFNRFRLYRHFVWRRIKGCNMACWADDARKIVGFDISLIGWGHEDADFVFRLQDSGVQRISGAWATEVLHLHHPVGDQTRATENAIRVREKILAKASSAPLRE